MAPQTKPDYFASHAELRHKFPPGDYSKPSVRILHTFGGITIKKNMNMMLFLNLKLPESFSFQFILCPDHTNEGINYVQC